MSDKTQAALEARKKKEKKSYEEERKKSQEKINAALKARESRIKNNLQSTFSDFETRINAEIDAYKKLSTPSWGGGNEALKSSLDSTRQNRINVTNLIREIEAYRKHLGNKKTDTLLGTLNSMKNTYNSHASVAEVRSQFETEGDYFGYLMNNTGDKTDNNAVKARQDAYTATIARIAEIEKELDKGEQDNSDALVAEKERLEKYARQYERGNKYKDDIFAKNATRDDYEEKSANRDFGNSTKDEYDEFDTNAYGGYISYHDGYQSVPVEGQFPYTTSPEDAMKQMGEELAINDPLGFYFDNYGICSEDNETNSYSPTEIMYYSPANLIAGAEYNTVLYKGDRQYWSNLTEDEIGMYYFILNDQGKDAALAFLDGMENELAYRETEEYKEYLKNASLGEVIFANVVSVPANIIGGAVAITDDAINLISGQELEPYNSAHAMKNFADITRSVSAEKLNQLTDNGEFLGMTTGDVYQSLMSGIDSFAGATLFGPSYMGFMVAGAASSGVKDLYESGASTGQIISGAFINGLSEYIGEKIPLDHFFKMKGNTGSIGKLILNAFKQGGYELGGEMITEVSNIIGEAVNLRSESEWAKLLKENNGAFWETVGEIAKERVWKAGAGGFISGMLMGGAGTTADYAQTQSAYKAEGKAVLDQGGVDTLKALALDIAGEQHGIKNFASKVALERQANKVAGEVYEGKGLGGRISAAVKNSRNAKAVGRLSDTVRTTISEQNMSEIKADLRKQGMSNAEANKIANEFIAVVENGGEFSEELQNAIEKSVEDGTALGETWANVFGKDSAIVARNNRYNLARSGFETDSKGELTEEGKKTATKKMNDKLGITGTVETDAKEFDVNSDGENFSKKSGNAIESLAFVDTEDGIKIKVSDTETVDARDVSYKDGATAVIFSAVANLGADAKTANEIANMFSNITDENQAVYIASDMALAYKYGRMNYGDSYLTKLDSLAPQDAKIIYNKGREQAILHRKNEAAKVKSAVEKAKTEKTNGKKVGNLTLAENISTDSKSRTSKENANIMVAEIMSKLTGTEIYVGKSSLDRNGKRTWTLDDGTVVTANGLYLPGKIYLDINAGNFGEGILLETLGHELGHHIKRYNPELFAKIADYLMEEFEKNGYDVRGMIHEEIRKIEAREAREKALAKRNGKPFKAKTEQQIEEEAQEEFVCQAFVGMLQDGTVAKSLADLKQQDYSVWKVIMDTIKDLLEKWGLIIKEYEGRELSTKEGQALASMKDVFKKVQEMYIEGLKGANENFDALGTMNDNVFMLQQRHYNEANPVTGMSGRDTLYEYLENTYGTEDANNLISTIDNINNVMDEIKRDHPELNVFSQWQDTEIDIDENGHPIFTTSINNGDYELNQDFSRVCKKRRQLDFVLNLLAEDPNFEASYLTKEDFVAINNAIKEHGFEIACALCFVDSKRFRQAEWADSFANTWNDILSSLMVDGSNPTPFNFATKSANIADENINLDLSKPITLRKWSNGKVSETRKYDNIEHMLSKVEKNGKMAYIEGNSNIRTIATLIRDNPNLRHTFRGADIISSSGFDSIQKLAPEVRNILDGWGGSSVPKPSSSDASYDNSVLNIKGYNKKAAYAMGGVRMNSFSDFMAHMFFDYCEAFADLSAKQLPMQSYTKELVFARLFGKLGGKINMSGIAAVRKNTLPLTESKKDGITKDQAEKNKEIEKRFAGLDISRLMEHLQKDVSDITTEDLEQNLDLCEYLWADESIDMIKATLLQSGILYDKLSESKQAECYELLKDGKFDKAFKVAGKNNVDTDYAANIGTIVVGVSDAHIRKLLRDNTIRMVIPYHKSGLNPLIANLLKISVYDDYTDFQSTGVVLKGAKKRVNLSSKEIKDSLGLVDFNFYDYFGKTIDGVTYDGSAVADKYLDWCENGVYDAEVGDYVYYTTKDKGYILAKDLHKKLKVVPKFEQFSNELNYYKVLEDFDCYNTITGEHSPQGAVKFLEKGLPEDYKKILTDALIEEQQVQDDFRDHLDNKGLKEEIMGIVSKRGYNATEGVGIAKKVSKAEYKEQARELPKAMWEVSPGRGIRNQERDSEGNTLTKEQIDFFKDSKVRDKDGNLELMYHGSKEATFTIFDKAKKTVAKAFFFTNNENVAKTYAGENAKVGENVPAKEGIYKGYINASNPLVVDGTADVSGTYKRIEAEYTDNLWRVNVGNRELVLTNKQFDQFRGNLDPKSSDQAYEQISRAKRMGDNPVVILENATVRYKAPSNFADIEFKGKSMTTNEIVDYAYAKGFDSVIFDNINDFGANGTADVDSSKIVVVFASAQFKDVDNKTPTSDPDIRYQERDLAPTFYSQMGKVVEGVKQEKLAANSVVNMLRGKGVKAEEIRWSGIVPFLEGKKSVTKHELLDFINGSMLEIEMSEATAGDLEFVEMNNGDYQIRLNDDYDSAITLHKENGVWIDDHLNTGWDSPEGAYEHFKKQYKGETRWKDYTLDGGTNYRELVFTMPNSSYSNNMMRIHWGEDAEGVLVHARIQDFDVNGKKMLFIEEIQSDWHNEGHKLGYEGDSKNSELGLARKRYVELGKELEKMHEDLKNAKSLPIEERHSLMDSYFDKSRTLENERDSLYKKFGMDVVADTETIPDAPFKDTYHEFVLKRLLRMAAEQGYDSIGWTPSEIQSQRWSDEYAEGYRIEYDQDIPKFLKKYGRQWGATVSHTALNNKSNRDTYTDNDGKQYKSVREWYDSVMDSYADKDMSVWTDYLAGLTKVIQVDNTMNIQLKRTGEILDEALHITTEPDTVWSMEITDSMRDSVLYEGQPMLQERDTDTSNRSILASALESVAQNDIEKNKLAEYKKKISLIESEEQRLSEIQKQLFTKGGVEPSQRKDLQFEAKQIANRINTYDRQLLNLESTTALKNVLNREKALAMKKQKQMDAEYIKQYKEKVQNDKKALVSKYQESRKKAVESRTKTAMRHKIKSVVGDLNSLLLKPTKERHVPEEMKIAVAEALSIVNMDTVDADTRVAKYNALIAKAKDPDVIASLTETRDRILNQGNKLADKLTKLKDAYGMVRESADDSLRSMYDDVIYNKIESVQKAVGKTPLRNMTLGQLESVYELYKMVLTTIRDSNKAFAENLTMTRQALGSNTFAEIKENNKVRDRIKHQFLEKSLWQNLKPMQAMKTIGSNTLQTLWNNILYGQEVFAQDYYEAVEFAKEMKDKHGYKKWNKDKLYSFESKSGKIMKLNLEQMMSIYAYSKRQQADEHIEYGGILLNESIIKEKNKLGKTVEIKVNDSTAYRLDKMQVGEIIATLEKEFPGAKAFVDEMQKYLSETMGNKGNEVSMKMYGIKLFKEEHYFPLKSSKDFMEAANAKLKGDVKIKNKGMTKSTVEHARTPIVLENFLDVWGNHINEMSMYHGLVLPLEDFSRTLNYSFKADDTLNTDAESVRTALHDAFGENADNYLNELLKAINGGVLHDSSAQFADKMISKFKKAKVMASLSVIVQQPTAIIRAMGIIEPKYFVAQNFNHKATWEELKTYCPTAIIKETGSFDTNMGRTIVDMIKDERGFTDKVGDLLGKAPAYMDEVGWNMIWRALKNKVATEQKLSGEELLKECGKQMTLIINETQVYDSVMSRNELMRSKSTFTKMATAFMAEPSTVANMIYGAALDIKRGKKGIASKTIAATIGSVVINGLVSAMVYALRDDDEDETFLEKYLSSATTEVLDGLNPLTYIPFIKDAYSLFQGYKVERTDMALIKDVVEAIDDFYNVLDPEAYEGMSRKEIAKHIYENATPLLTSICDMFGLPVGNVLRDAEAIIINDNVPMSQTTSQGIGYAFKEGALNTLPKIVQKIIGTDSKSDKLYDAIVSGDATQIDRLKSDYKDDKAYEQAVRKALRDNDPRIKVAAEARIGGDIAEYTRIVKEIKAEGFFSQDTIVASVNAEINAINKGESSSSENSATENKESSIYTTDDYFASIVGGDQATAYVVKEDIIKTDVANGKDRDEAEDNFNSKFASHVREQYEDGYISDYEAEKMLINYGGKSEQDAASKVQYWSFKQEYPDYDDLSEEAVDNYYNDVEPHGISIHVYYDYSKQRSKCKGTDKNGDGKTDSGSVKKEVLQVINSLPITKAQKDALYYLNGWSARTIYEAPWR